MKVDLAVLPENWPMQETDGGAVTNPPAQPVSGPLIAMASAIAKKHRMNVVAPIRENRGGRLFNTAVVIDRSGEVVGTYSKVFPVWGSIDRTNGEILHVDPSEEGVKVGLTRAESIPFCLGFAATATAKKRFPFRIATMLPLIFRRYKPFFFRLLRRLFR